MAKWNRDDKEDARQAVEELVPDSRKRQEFINLLCDAITFADAIDSNNWNLNLDPNGKYLRFNTGHEYCIELRKEELLILCDRSSLHLIDEIDDLSVEFMGWNGKRNIYDHRYGQVPDALAKTKNSIGCIIDIDKDIYKFGYKFKTSNRDFIKAAMKTGLMPNMRRAHSKGAVEYIFSEFNESRRQTVPGLSDILEMEEIQLGKAMRLSREERLSGLEKAQPKPERVAVLQMVFVRNQLVVAEILFRANGHCEQCKESAPFPRKSDNTPYLEVHHKVRLADGGDDTVENAIALCPNCHRKAHYG